MIRFNGRVYGVGIMDKKTVNESNGQRNKIYEGWRSMIKTCYTTQFKKPNKDICKDWLVFSQYEKDILENPSLRYSVNIAGHKYYGPEDYINNKLEERAAQLKNKESFRKCTCSCTCGAAKLHN